MLGESGLRINLFLVCNAFFDISKLDETCQLRNNLCTVRLTAEHHLIFFDQIAMFAVEVCTMRNNIPLQDLAGIGISNIYFAIFLNDNNTEFFDPILIYSSMVNRFDILELDLTIIECLGLCFSNTTLSGTTLVERTKGKLRSRLTDRLRSDNAYSFPDFHEFMYRKICSITL